MIDQPASDAGRPSDEAQNRALLKENLRLLEESRRADALVLALRQLLAQWREEATAERALGHWREAATIETCAEELASRLDGSHP